MLTTKHAVLCSVNGTTYLMYLKEDKETYGYSLVPGGIESFEELLTLATEGDITHYWIHSSVDIEATEEFCAYDEEAWDLRIQSTSSNKVYAVHGWKLPSGGQKSFDIIFPRNTRWAKTNKGSASWGAKASPKQLLMTISYLEQATGMPMGSSPSTMGWKMVTALHPKEVADIPQAKLFEMHFTKNAGADLVDHRPLTEAEQGRKFLMKFDKNSAYLSAAAQEAYGIGTPVLTTKWDEKAVGVWRVTVHSTADVPFIPFKKWFAEKHTRWLSTPIVRLQKAVGFEVEVHEGYVFTQKFMLLESWARKIWKIRESFRTNAAGQWEHETSRLMAYEAIKQIAVSTIGLTGSDKFGKDEDTTKRRPDVKLQTVSRTYELMQHNLMKVYRQEGKLPVMAATDALYYLVDTTDPRKELATLLAREGALGGFKYEGYIEVTPEVLVILNDQNMNVARRLERLNEMGWKK